MVASLCIEPPARCVSEIVCFRALLSTFYDFFQTCYHLVDWLDSIVTGIKKEHAQISFLHKKFKPIGASSGYRIVSLFLPGHLVPAPFFNGFSSLPTTYLLECFQFLVMIRLLHKLSDADRRLTRQDRLFGPRLGRAGGCPATPRKADDHGDDCPTNKAPHAILNLRCSL